MSGYTGPVMTDKRHTHHRDVRPALLPKSYLVYHLGVPHEANGRLSHIAEDPRALRKWSIEELRRAHRELHGEQV